MAKSKSGGTTSGEVPKRLTPTPEVMRELYLLSGNNCAMPDCDGLIIDAKGVVVGEVCHISSAMPDGARFDPQKTNEQRREVSNLILLCRGHHTQVDSKQRRKDYPVEVLTKIKREHEAKFKGLADALTHSFNTGYADSTDKLKPTDAKTYARLATILPEAALKGEDAARRKKQISAYVAKMKVVPDAERLFMLAIIKRALKLGKDEMVVHVDDVKSALSVGHSRIKTMGDALSRYGVGDVDLYGTGRGTDEHHVGIRDPSDYLTWAEIAEFCDNTGVPLDDFVLRLKFGLLDG
ncbi:MAG: hypothetical protein ACK4I0_11445 [Brevundimonas sp.]|uniref:hypothetical protein n=1 Tax=Brevundimonas sp. TaxID=1871086 RepID=UPI00391C3896